MESEKKLKDSDEFETPMDVIHAAFRLAPISFDLAATNDNNVITRMFNHGMHDLFFTKSHNALNQDWARIHAAIGDMTQLWLNPPFSKPNLPLFAEKTREEASRGANVGFLGPANTASKWFHDLFFRGGDITSKSHIPRGALRGLVLDLDFTFYTLKLHIFEYRLAFGHPEMPEAEEANKGHVYGLFRSKRRYSPKLRVAPAQESPEQPAGTPADPSPEG